MAKKDSLSVRDHWLALKDLSFPDGVTAAEVELIVEAYPVRLAIEVIMPAGYSPPEDFSYQKNPQLKKFRATVESKVVEILAHVVQMRKRDEDGDEKAYENAKKGIETLNKFLEQNMSELRVQIRTVIAKMLGPKVKPEHLLTAGSSGLKQFRIRAGVFDSEVADFSGLLNIDKALNRKKPQFCAFAWKNHECVVAIRLKKPFKNSDLKELKEALPDKAKQGAKKILGRFTASSRSNLEFRFPEKTKFPKRKAIADAVYKQVGTSPHIVILQYNQDDIEEDEAASKKSKDSDAKSKNNDGKGKQETSKKSNEKTTPNKKQGNK